MDENKSPGEMTVELLQDLQTSLGLALQLIRGVVSKLQQLESAAKAVVVQQALEEAQRPAMVTGEIPEVEGADRDGEGGHVVNP